MEHSYFGSQNVILGVLHSVFVFVQEIVKYMGNSIVTLICFLTIVLFLNRTN